MNNNILLEKHKAVWLITINRPDKMNSLDLDDNEELVEIWRRFDLDPEARVAVVTGAGTEAFCAGADLKTYTRQYATTPAPEFRRKYTNGPGFGGITRGMDIYKPTLAAVNGYAISGGFELALACDIRFATPNAEFALQDSKWGFHACDGGLIRLPQIVGLGHAMEIILSGDRVDCETGYRMGLVNRIVPQEDLVASAMDYASMLATRSPLSHQFAKEVLKRAVGLSMDEALKLESRSFYDVGQTDDLSEGTTAFREKRQARFQGN